MGGYHAWLSPSSSARWMTCAFSAVIESTLPKDEGSEYAAEGTLAHTFAEYCLRHGTQPMDYQVIEQDGVAVEVTEDMPGFVQTYVDNIRALSQGGKLYIEQKVPIGRFTGEKDATGTADAIILLPLEDGTYELQVHDLKYGIGEVVSPNNNSQLMLYALGALEKFELIYDITRIRLFIHQPRVFNEPREWETTLGRFDIFKSQIYSARENIDACRREFDAIEWPRDVKAVEAVNLKFGKPTDYACRWCRYKAGCTALRQAAAKSVFDSFAALEGDEPPPAVVTIEETAEMREAGEAVQEGIMNVEEYRAHLYARLRVAMDSAPLVEHWLKAVRAAVESELLDARNDPAVIELLGYKLVEGKLGNRRWGDEAAAEEALKKLRLKKDQMYNEKLKSPTDMEKVLKKAEPKKWEKLQPHIKRDPGGTHVAPLDDQRPAKVYPAVAEAFEDLGDEVPKDDGSDLI